MIGIIFYFGSELLMVTIKGNAVTFTKDGMQSGIDGLRLSKEGVNKEFPDLKDNPAWREEAIKRFKDKIKNFGSEDKVKEYLIKEMNKFGYTAKYIQKQGFRVEAIK